ANEECGQLSDQTFGQVRGGNTRFAEDALTGFNKQFHNWQGSVSIQQELRPGMALNVGYFRTWYGGFLVTKNMAVTPADFDSYCITEPANDSRLPNAGGKLCGFYDVKPALYGKNDYVRTQASHFGKRTEPRSGILRHHSALQRERQSRTDSTVLPIRRPAPTVRSSLFKTVQA